MTKKIMWDKGHGGSDPGAIGNGLYEKTLVSKIITYAMNYMQANYIGFEQRTTRTGDQTLSLTQRTNLANNWGADVFISSHINAGGGTGFETFIYDKSTDKETVSLQTAIHEEVLSTMKTFGAISDRGKKKANLAVCRQTKMPAILTETLFIDTVKDAQRLKNESFLKAVGEAHAIGVAAFLKLKKKVTNVSSGMNYRLFTGTFKTREKAEEVANNIEKAFDLQIRIREE